LTLLVRGAHSNEVKFRLSRVFPDVLKVTLGETKPIGSLAATQTALIIHIPKGSPPLDYLGPEHDKLGQIVLETGHPQMPKLPIFVRFAVVGDVSH
jgi:hypothetical protein